MSEFRFTLSVDPASVPLNPAFVFPRPGNFTSLRKVPRASILLLRSGTDAANQCPGFTMSWDVALSLGNGRGGNEVKSWTGDSLGASPEGDPGPRHPSHPVINGTKAAANHKINDDRTHSRFSGRA